MIRFLKDSYSTPVFITKDLDSTRAFIHRTFEVDISDDFSQKIIRDFLSVRPKAELLDYFPDAISCAYMTDHFSVHPADLPVGIGEQEELIEGPDSKDIIQECSSINVWLCIISSYLTLDSHVVPQLILIFFPYIGMRAEIFSHDEH